MADVKDLKPGDIISYSAISDTYIAIVISIADSILSIMDISSTNKRYYTPQGYTYSDYQQSVDEHSLKDIKIVGYIPIIEFIRNQLPEHFL